MYLQKIGAISTSGDSNIVFAKTRLFEERYSGGVLDMNIFCFLLVNENDGTLLNTTSLSSKRTAKLTNAEVKQF